MTVHSVRFAVKHVDAKHDFPAAGANERIAGLEVMR